MPAASRRRTQASIPPSNGVMGWVKNRVRSSRRSGPRPAHRGAAGRRRFSLGASKFTVRPLRDPRPGRLGWSATRWTAPWRRARRHSCLGMRPFPVQIIGACAMCRGAIAEMATGEGKTLTASLSRRQSGRGPADRCSHHRQRLSRRPRRRGDGPDLQDAGPDAPATSFTKHAPSERLDHYRRNVVYVTSKELVADFLRDQIVLGNIRTSHRRPPSACCMSGGHAHPPLLVPGLCAQCWSTKPTAC